MKGAGWILFVSVALYFLAGCRLVESVFGVEERYTPCWELDLGSSSRDGLGLPATSDIGQIQGVEGRRGLSTREWPPEKPNEPVPVSVFDIYFRDPDSSQGTGQYDGTQLKSTSFLSKSEAKKATEQAFAKIEPRDGGVLADRDHSRPAKEKKDEFYWTREAGTKERPSVLALKYKIHHHVGERYHLVQFYEGQTDTLRVQVHEVDEVAHPCEGWKVYYSKMDIYFNKFSLCKDCTNYKKGETYDPKGYTVSTSSHSAYESVIQVTTTKR